MSLAPGVRLGPYEILAPLGSGAMGVVYRARDPRLGREVAIKVLSADLSKEPERLQRFEQEARAAAALNHPNILAVYDVGVHDGAPYIVSELLHGGTLRERSAPVPARKAADYAVQIANGLAAAHEKGIVHRDLKPENVFVTTDDRVKILDFGLAKLTQDEPAPSGTSTVATLPPGTQPGLVMGTIGYMSPEQVRGLSADRRSDIFSLGAILYEMLSGRRAFQAATIADTMSAILKDQPPDLAVIDPRIPSILVRIVERCLEKAPVARFQSAQDLAFALAGLSASPGTGAFAVAGSTPGTSRRERLIWAGVTAVLVVATVTLAAVAYFGRPQEITASVKLSVPAPKGVTQVVGLMVRISPDGSRLLFPAISEGEQRLWVRPLNMLDAYPLPGTERATYPFWSPDGQSLGFFADGKLKKIELAGGPTVTICDAPQEAGGTWNANGTIVFSSAGRLHRVPATGGASTLLNGTTDGRVRTTLAHPLFLPDGRHFLYLDTGTGGVGEGTIYAGVLDSTDRTMVLRADSNVWYGQGHLFFLRDTTLMAQPFDAARLALSGDAVPMAEQVQRAAVGAPRGAFSVSDRVLAYQAAEGGPGVPTNLVWFDRSGRQVGTLGERRDYGDVTLSPDGMRAAVSVLEPPNGRDIWLFDVGRGVPTRFTLDPTDDLASIWSPDGARLVFSSRRKGHDDLYEKSAGGGGTENPLLVDSFDKYPMSWSADGRFILYSSGSLSVVGNRGSLWILPTFGDKKPYSVLQSPTFSEYPGQFSPDGRWIAYTSTESGRGEVYVVSFPGLDHKTRISTDGGSWARWRRNGKEIFYLAPGPTGSLMAAAVNGTGSEFRVEEVRPLFQARWRNGVRYGYDAAPDGQRFLVASLAEQPAVAPITLVVNWTADLMK